MILYMALIREVGPVTGTPGPVEQWFDPDFSSMMGRIDRYHADIVTLHEIDFSAATVKEFVDAPAAFDAWRIGSDYETCPAGIYDQRTQTVFQASVKAPKNGNGGVPAKDPGRILSAE